jgi:N-acetylated-alpha-linked acidic dipeptidase
LLSWSGEEYGLLGSTGWAELHADHLQRATAYLNVDTVVSGDFLSVAVTPSLSTVWKQVLFDLHESKHAIPFGNAPFGNILDANTNWILNDPKEKMLGSGSDYTVFLDHLGIASLDFEFGKKSTCK